MKSSGSLRIGLGQIPIRMGDKPANVDELLRTMEEAARERCDLIAFPECSLAGWLSSKAKSAAETIPGPLTERLAKTARRHRMAVVIGVEEKEDGKVFNSALFLGRDGRILGRHRKVNELEIARPLYTPGSALGVFEFEGRTVALSICADSWTPTVTDALYELGARVIFSPSAWAVDPGGEATNLSWIRETYRQRTRGRKLCIVSPNGVGAVTEGPWKGRRLQGNSLVTGADGKTLLEGPPNRPALLVFRLPR